jgi:transcriptional regulator with XRE-family HTH domain
MQVYSHAVKNNASPIFTPCFWNSGGEKAHYSHMVNKEQQFSRAVAAKVKRMLKERKLSQKWLAEKTGLVDGMISMLLRGERTMMAYQIERIAAALGVSPAELMDDGGEDDKVKIAYRAMQKLDEKWQDVILQQIEMAEAAQERERGKKP